MFSGAWILPQAFSLGLITIHYYGLVMALAVAAGFYIAKRRTEKHQIDSKVAEDVIFWAIIGGFIGARLYHVLSSFSYYQHHALDILKVWQGGLSIFGAIFGGLISIWVYKKLTTNHFSLFTFLNWLTPSIIIGQIIGRFGNLFNYEAFGYSTNLPWKMFVPYGFRPIQYQSSNFFHPWFLYEQIGLLMVLMLITTLEKTGKTSLFVWYLLLYNILRFGLEFLRIDSPFIYGFRQNAAISLLIILLTSILLFLTYPRNEKS